MLETFVMFAWNVAKKTWKIFVFLDSDLWQEF